MLILSRKRGQSIVINQDIEIIITAIEGDQVKIGLSAPREYNIVRKEVLDDVRNSNRNSLPLEDDLKQFRDWVQSHGPEVDKK